ncbi:MAG: hypothetical protein K0S58_1527 [Nitrospira sp.]|jgi:hypothetical protein|nr:hypothetical protein [Nitrospira sp.]
MGQQGTQGDKLWGNSIRKESTRMYAYGCFSAQIAAILLSVLSPARDQWMEYAISQQKNFTAHLNEQIFS